MPAVRKKGSGGPGKGVHDNYQKVGREKMKTLLSVLMVFCILGASTAFAAQQPTKEEVYTKISGFIETANQETEYEKKLEAYSMGLLSVGMNSYKNIFSCGDTELVKINEDMRALEKELWVLYNALQAEGKTPKIKPGKYQSCEEVLAEKDASAKAKAQQAQAPAKPRVASGNPAPQSTPEKSVCGYCGKAEYGKCFAAPSGTTMNKLGNHRHIKTGGKTCVWCGSTNRAAGCSLSVVVQT